MSCQAKDLELYGEAAGLAEAARRGYPGGSHRVTAILELRIAEAHAQLGETTQCRTAIDHAYNALRHMTSDDGDPSWSYWMDEAQVDAQAGYCLTRLGDWSNAGRYLRTALRGQDDSYSREGVLRRALLAVTYASQGSPEQACDIANTAIDTLAADVDSDRCIGHIRKVQSALLPYRNVAAVRDFQERADHLFGVQPRG
jgi:tetratricopeptide (TPR) repeat protein